MKKLLSVSLVLLGVGAQAQQKTTYFPNGAKQFEGEYIVGYPVSDVRDAYNFDTAADRRKLGMASMTMRPMMERDNAPQHIYNGKCTFYYDNGKISFTGPYVHGIKNGLFSYSYFTGEKEAELNYVMGMADGKWKAWHKNGKMRLEQNYVAFTTAEMDTFYNRKMNAATPFGRPDALMERSRLRKFTNDSLQKMPNSTFSKFTEMESSFCRNAHWNGDFITCYPSGNKCTEMHYANDVRVGKWYYRDDSGNIKAQLEFTDGKISAAVNKMPAEQNRMPMGMNGMPGRPGMPMMPGARDTARAARGTMVPRAEQPPVPAVEVNKYVRENIKYPEEAKKNKVQGMVMLSFVVNEDGTTTDHKVMRGLGSGCDEEAIRLIKSMPPWKPGMTGGKPVKSSFMVPVQFMDMPGKK